MDVSHIYLLLCMPPAIFPAPPWGRGGQNRSCPKQAPHKPRAALLHKASTSAARRGIVIGVLSIGQGHINIANQNVMITHKNSEFSELFHKTERNKINIWLRWLFPRLFCPGIRSAKCDLNAVLSCYVVCPLIHIPPGPA